MAGIAAALTGFILYVAGVVSQPPMTVLYSGLDPREAAAVAAKLDAAGTPYTAKGDGGTLLVPADQVQKLRMQLAGEGLPSAGVGYEIFDKSDAFGATAFVQNINRLRALEGELARSIRTLDTIAQARVHLVIPERQIFARDAQTPSASVVVGARGAPLQRSQVVAIQNLVAAAVPGLAPDRVAVVDERGFLLAGGGGNSDDAIAAEQEERTNAFEDRLRQRVENIVASIVGPGRVRVQVAAEMDFNRVSATSETYDPDGRVVRSQQTVEQVSNEQDAATSGAVSVGSALPGSQQAAAGASGPGTSSANSRTEETVNYEISKTVKTEVQETGRVTRLSVAVVVDGSYAANADGTRTYTPRSQEEMAKITELVKSAIGYDEARGDRLEVANMRFAELDTGPAGEVEEPFLGLEPAMLYKIAEAFILSLAALLMGLFVVKPIATRVLAMPASAGAAAGGEAAQIQASEKGAALPARESGGGTALAPPKRESMIDIDQIEGQVRESSIRKVGEVVGAHPEEAMAILRTWLHQPV